MSGPVAATVGGGAPQLLRWEPAPRPATATPALMPAVQAVVQPMERRGIPTRLRPARPSRAAAAAAAAPGGAGGGVAERPALRPARTPSKVGDKARSSPYRVLLHNDDVNKREYVVSVLMKVVEGMAVDDAVNVMNEAHQHGTAAVIVCGQPDAERYCEGLRGNGLIASIEPASGGGGGGGTGGGGGGGGGGEPA